MHKHCRIDIRYNDLLSSFGPQFSLDREEQVVLIYAYGMCSFLSGSPSVRNPPCMCDVFSKVLFSSIQFLLLGNVKAIMRWMII